jgi:hypothetical protein
MPPAFSALILVDRTTRVSAGSLEISAPYRSGNWFVAKVIPELLHVVSLDEGAISTTYGLRGVTLTEEPHLVLRRNASPKALGCIRAAVFGSELWGTRGMTRGEKSDPPGEWESRKRSRRLQTVELHLLRY